MVETERERVREWYCRRHAYVLKKERWDRGQERTECKKSAWKRQRNEKRISNYLVLSLVLCYLVLVVFIFYLQNDDWLLTGFSILYLLSFLLYSLHVNMGFFFHLSLSLRLFLSRFRNFIRMEFIAFSGSLCYGIFIANGYIDFVCQFDSISFIFPLTARKITLNEWDRVQLKVK